MPYYTAILYSNDILCFRLGRRGAFLLYTAITLIMAVCVIGIYGHAGEQYKIQNNIVILSKILN